MSALILWSVTALLFLVGLLGIFIPLLPGILLVFAGILFFAFFTDFAIISGSAVAVFGLLSLLAWGAEYAGAAIGARAGGGKKYTLLGALLGAVVGAAIGPLGIFVGSFIGAVLGAIFEGQTHQRALIAAAWSILGLVGAKLVQFALAVIMIIAFLVIVLF